MCVILVCPPKVRPDLETLSLCAKANPHGAGIAWRADNQVRWFKTNDVDEIFRLSSVLRGELVIHFRIASVGRVCEDLRHPFPVSKRAVLLTSGSWNAVLFQNGTWNGWRAALAVAAEQGHRIPKGEMNDTRAAAFLCSIYGRKFLKQCAPSRWVFFDAKQTSMFGDWFKRDGTLFSNLNWEACSTLLGRGVISQRHAEHLNGVGNVAAWVLIQVICRVRGELGFHNWHDPCPRLIWEEFHLR